MLCRGWRQYLVRMTAAGQLYLPNWRIFRTFPIMPPNAFSRTIDQNTEIASWNAFRGGDMEALGLLYEKYFPLLYAYGKRISLSDEFAKDCLQDLFVKLWERRERLPEVATCQGYFFQCYRALLMDRLKEQGRMNHMGEQDMGEWTLPVQDLIVAKESVEENVKRLVSGIASLPKKQQEIIYLRFYQGLSYHEISEALQINNQSVRNAVSGSLKILRKLFPLALFTLLRMIA